MDRQRPLAYRRVQDRYLSIVLDKIKEKKNKNRNRKKGQKKNIDIYKLSRVICRFSSNTIEIQLTLNDKCSLYLHSILARITGYDTFRTGRTVFEAKKSLWRYRPQWVRKVGELMPSVKNRPLRSRDSESRFKVAAVLRQES